MRTIKINKIEEKYHVVYDDFENNKIVVNSFSRDLYTCLMQIVKYLDKSKDNIILRRP